MHADCTGLKDLPGCVIGYAFTVLKMPGARFAEKVYENAPAIEIRSAGLAVVQQCSVMVDYNATPSASTSRTC
jgi:hypothetical protein